MKRLACLILAFLMIALIVSPVPADDEQGAAPPLQGQHDAKETARNADPSGQDVPAPDPDAERISDAGVLVELESTIQSDKARLEELKAELKKREETFEQMNEYMKREKENLEQKKKELEELAPEEPPARAEALKAEIQTLEQDQTLLKQRSDLEFQTAKTTMEQIRTLTEKIERNTHTVDRLSGKLKPEQDVTAPQGTPRTPQAEAPSPPISPIPGVPVSTPEPPAEEEKPPDVLETAEQIEARKKAERKEQEAREAAEVIVEYVERKEALQEQIALEKKLLKTSREGLENFEGLLATREKLMDEKIATGAGKEELSKIQRETKYIQTEMEKLRDEIEERNDRLGDLNDQLDRIQEEQILVMERAERKRAEAESARKKSTWLESPLHPRNVSQWGMTRAPRMFAILLATFGILIVVRFVLKRTSRVIMMGWRGEAEQGEKRATTLAATLTSAATGIIIIGGVFMAIEEAGVDIKTVLGGAAVIGLAVAFGAQNLMRDYFNGFMILMEGQFELNDIITIGDVTGTVERMSMRMTQLRDLQGRAHFIPNGQIRQVTNLTHAWSQALFNVGVSYQENADRVMEVLMDVAREFCQDPEWGPSTIGEPQMLGVDELGEAVFHVKFVIRTKADKMWAVRREMLRRIKNKFDELGIRIPIPHRVVLQAPESPERNQG